MSKLEELIKELCPNGVEYKTLGEACDTVTDYVAAGSFAEIAKNVTYIKTPDFAQLVRTKDLKAKFTNNDTVYISEHAFNYLWRVNLDRESIILPNIGNCGEVYYVTPKCLPYKHNVLATNAILLRSTTCNNKYLYHLFTNNEFQKNLKKITSPSGQTKFNKTDLKKISIPVPPMEVQREIVRILDNFTELTAELTARKKQYEYYREKLLNEANTKASESRRFGDIATIVRGASPRPISSFITDKENGINWIKIGDVQPDSKYITQTKEKITLEGAKKSRMVNVGDFILSNSMSFGRPYIMKIQGCIHDGWLAISNFEKYFQSDFLYYLLNSNTIQHEMEQKASNGTVKNLNADIVRNLELPLPPLAEQERIVSILDRFDKLCNDISEGLPAEIEARKKQYEYYRDKLLTFKNIDSEAN